MYMYVKRHLCPSFIPPPSSFPFFPSGGREVEGGRWREGGGGWEVEGGRWRVGGGGREGGGGWEVEGGSGGWEWREGVEGGR